MRIVLASLMFVGCGSSTPSPTPRPSAADPLTTEEGIALCERLHREAVPCAREFIELNIDLRAKYSPQFAEAVKDPAVRAQAVEAGVAEAAHDAEHARERCTEYVKPQWGPPQPRSDLAVLDSCYAKASCADKMACLRPVIEPRFQYRAAREAEHR